MQAVQLLERHLLPAACLSPQRLHLWPELWDCLKRLTFRQRAALYAGLRVRILSGHPLVCHKAWIKRLCLQRGISYCSCLHLWPELWDCLKRLTFQQRASLYAGLRVCLRLCIELLDHGILLQLMIMGW